MTRLFMIGILCVCRIWDLHAQGVTTWIEQLAALRTLEQTVQHGYSTVKNGLTNIGDLRYDEYQLHSEYYGSLATVNPVISADPKTEQLVKALGQLVEKLRIALAYWQTRKPIDQP